ARSSVGAFYARFADKDALLAYINERLFEEGRQLWDEFLAPERWQERGTAEIVGAVVSRLVERRRANRGLLRALSLYARARPAPAFGDYARDINRHFQHKLTELLLT